MPSDFSTEAIARSEAALRHLLNDLALFLERFAVRSWPLRLRGLAEGAPLNRAKIRGMRPGMGGLDDLWICRTNGHQIEADDELRVNEQLDAFRRKIWAHASQLDALTDGTK